MCVLQFHECRSFKTTTASKHVVVCSILPMHIGGCFSDGMFHKGVSAFGHCVVVVCEERRAQGTDEWCSTACRPTLSNRKERDHEHSCYTFHGVCAWRRPRQRGWCASVESDGMCCEPQMLLYLPRTGRHTKTLEAFHICARCVGEAEWCAQLKGRAHQKAEIRQVTCRVAEDRSATWKGSTDQIDDVVFLALIAPLCVTNEGFVATFVPKL